SWQYAVLEFLTTPLCFVFKHTTTTEIYTLSLHDALPILKSLVLEEKMKLSLRDFPIEREEALGPRDVRIKLHTVGICGSDVHYRSEEHTSELQSRENLVCRLLLEKKNERRTQPQPQSKHS